MANNKSIRYEQAYDGQWFEVPGNQMSQMCCGCCMVHHWEYKRVKGKLYARVRQDNKATYAARKRNKIEVKQLDK